MARRIGLGKLGTDSGTAKYGLRISKTSSDAVPSASSSATVAPENLIFDSLNPVGSLGLYKVFLIEDVPAITAQTNGQIGGGFDQNGTPGNKVQAYGETLSFVPLAICQQVVTISGTAANATAGAVYTTSIMNGLASPGNWQDSEGPSDGGWYFVDEDDQITIYNYGSTTIDVRAAIFYTPLT